MREICFNTRDELVRVDVDYMVYAMAEDNYVHLFFRNGQRIMLCITLQALEQQITVAEERKDYIRIGRRFLVNRRYIVHINLQKRQLVLSDLNQLKPITLTVPKLALKMLKQTLTTNSSPINSAGSPIL